MNVWFLISNRFINNIVEELIKDKVITKAINGKKIVELKNKEICKTNIKDYLTSYKSYNDFNDAYKYRFYDDDFKEYLNKHLLKYIDFASRVSIINLKEQTDKSVHDLMDEMYIQASQTKAFLEDYEINVVVFNTAPHKGIDYLIYVISKYLGIRTLICENAVFFKFDNNVERFFCLENIEDYGDFKSCLYKENNDNPDIKVKEGFSKNLPYMKGLNSRKIKFEQSLLYKLIFNINKGANLFHALSIYHRSKTYTYDIKRFSEDQTNFDFPFVYFALHKQPEKTTSTYGGIYNDQLLAIERLSTILPKNWKIIVKENPKQTYFMRSTIFFNRLLGIPNVILLRNTVSSNMLLSKCKIASTITGSLGFEAVCGGKNVIIFGFGVWYKSLPGVHQFSSEMDLIKVSENKIDSENLNNKYKEIYKKTLPGFIYQNDKNKDENSQNNMRNIKSSFDYIFKSL